MKGKKLVLFVFTIIGNCAFVFLQIFSQSWQIEFNTQMNLLNYGKPMFEAALVGALLNILSGIILATLFFYFGMNMSVGFPTKSLFRLINFFIPLIAVILKLLFSVGAFHLSLRYLLFSQWLLQTPIPSVWLGISIGMFFTVSHK